MREEIPYCMEDTPMFDRTTKTLLTLIAIALWVQLLSPMFIPVATKAQSTQEKQTIARAKSGQIPVAVDADAGLVYVVTADGMLYQYTASDLRKQAEHRIGEK
jgi:hypothetical protein